MPALDPSSVLLATSAVLPSTMGVATDTSVPAGGWFGSAMPSAWWAAKLKSLVRNTASMWVASTALSLFLSGSRRCAHFAAASALPISLSSDSIWSRSRPEASKLRRTALCGARAWLVSLPALPCRGRGVRAARLGGRLSSRPLPLPSTRRGRSGAGAFCVGGIQIGGIKIILPGNADQGEQGIAPGISQRRPHPMRSGGLANGADGPIRGDPLSRGVGQYGGQIDDPGGLVDGRGLDRGDLMLARVLRTISSPLESGA